MSSRAMVVPVVENCVRVSREGDHDGLIRSRHTEARASSVPQVPIVRSLGQVLFLESASVIVKHVIEIHAKIRRTKRGMREFNRRLYCSLKGLDSVSIMGGNVSKLDR